MLQSTIVSIGHLEHQTCFFTTAHPQSPRYDPATTYPVTSYQLTYIKQGGRETPTNRSLPPQPTSVTVGNLAKGTVYVFTLAPVNTAGPGATFTYEPTETFIDRELFTGLCKEPSVYFMTFSSQSSPRRYSRVSKSIHHSVIVVSPEQ